VVTVTKAYGGMTNAVLNENLTQFNEKVKKYSVILIPTGYVFRLTALGHVLKLGEFKRVNPQHSGKIFGDY